VRKNTSQTTFLQKFCKSLVEYIFDLVTACNCNTRCVVNIYFGYVSESD